MKFIIGYKQEMTQQYREDGTVVPVTVVKADPAVVTQVKTSDKEGYSAIQLGVGNRNKVGKSMAGHLKKVTDAGQTPYNRLREVRVDNAADFAVGDTISVQTFAAGDKVTVTGTSKGKGFQGVVKRHGFGGSPASHGHKDQLRMPGSIGSQDPQRVFKGMKMGGRTGGKQITVKNLEVVSIDPENNLLFVKGAIPGARNGLIVIAAQGDMAKDGSIFEVKESAPAEEVKAETTEEPTKQEDSEKAEEVKEESKPEVKEEKAEEPKEEVTEEQTNEETK